MPTPHEICAALRSYRIRARLRQQTVAECLGVAQSQISRWESGRDSPRPHNVEAIARLILGPEADPLTALAYFVARSRQNLLLFDSSHRLVARARPFQTSPNDLERFGAALDPDLNAAFAPAFRRYRDVLASPGGVVGITISVPFGLRGRDWTVNVQKTIYKVGGAALCLAELDFVPGTARVVRFEEVRLDADGRPRTTTTLWR